MRRTVIRIATLSLALVALAAPVAVARPADPPRTPQQAEAESFSVQPVLSPEPVARDHGVNWNTVGIGAGLGLLAVAAVAGVAATRIRRTRVPA